MGFTTYEFFVFFLAFLALYWIVKDSRWQNLVLLTAGYIFYGWLASWHVFVIFFSTLADYLLALGMERWKPTITAALRAAPRQLLRAQAHVELLELDDGPRCCGLGGTFNLAHPDLSQRIAQSLTAEIIKLAPDLVVTSCSGCLLQLHRQLAGTAITVMHLADFLAGNRASQPANPAEQALRKYREPL